MKRVECLLFPSLPSGFSKQENPVPGPPIAWKAQAFPKGTRRILTLTRGPACAAGDAINLQKPSRFGWLPLPQEVKKFPRAASIPSFIYCPNIRQTPMWPGFFQALGIQ